LVAGARGAASGFAGEGLFMFERLVMGLRR
jgi:hypothetical protein